MAQYNNTPNASGAQQSTALFADPTSARGWSAEPEAIAESEWQVKILSNRACLGQGTIRQMTYFPIKVSLPKGPAPEGATQWADGTLVYRRYSELVTLRRYLLLKYTSELIPPLPAKSNRESFSTAMCDNDTLALQQRQVQFFVQRLSETPAIYAYDQLVAPFMQLPRDDNDSVSGGEPEQVPSNVAQPHRQFASLTLVKAALEQAVSSYEKQLDHTDPNVFASSSSAVMTGWVRSTASFVSGLFSGGRKVDPLAVTEDEVQRQLSTDREFQRWSEIRSAIIKEQHNIAEIAKAAAAVTVNVKEMEQADVDVQNALLNFAECLTQRADSELKLLLNNTCELNPTRQMISRASYSITAHTEAMLFHEAMLIDSIVETVTLLLNRYRVFAHRRLNKISPMTPACVQDESVALLNTGSQLYRRLKTWLHSLSARFEQLNAARVQRMSKATLGPAIEIIENSEVWRLLHAPTFLSFDGSSR